jgi:hypothetical protein
MVCAPYVKRGIPIVRLNHLDLGQKVPRGFVGHEDTSQGISVGKSDPGNLFNWDEFFFWLRKETEVHMATQEYEELSGRINTLAAEVADQRQRHGYVAHIGNIFRIAGKLLTLGSSDPMPVLEELEALIKAFKAALRSGSVEA